MEMIVIPKEEFQILLKKAVSDAIRDSREYQAPIQKIKLEGGIDFALEILSEKADLNSKPTVYKWVHEGRIPFEKRGKKLWFYREGELGLIPWIESGMPHFGKQQAANRLADLNQ